MKGYDKLRNVNMNRIEYINKLKRYVLNEDDIEYKTFNIFKHPVIRLFFWKNHTEDIFFALYKYKDKYFSICDNTGFYKFINDESEDISYNILSLLLDNIVIYDRFDDINIIKYKDDTLIYNLNYLKTFFCY
jgi:hypothetical protein